VSSRRLSPAPRSFGILAREEEGTTKTESGIAADQLEFCGGEDSAHTIQVKVRYGDFTTLTRQLSVEEPITEARDIYRLGCHLLARKRLVSRPLRLLGLGVSNLREPTAQQLSLL